MRGGKWKMHLREDDDLVNDYKKRNLVILLIILFNKMFQSTYKYAFFILYAKNETLVSLLELWFLEES